MNQALNRINLVDRQRYEREGYLAPLRVLSDDEITTFRQAYYDYTFQNQERLAALAPNEKYQVLSETHFVLPWVCQIASHPRILDDIEPILGPNILAWNTIWFTKMPGDKSFVSWHQDGTYWNLHPPNVVTAWVALTPSISETGCLRVVPGTHKEPMMPQRETYRSENMLSRGQEIAVEVDERQAVDLALAPGEMSLHHIWIVHGSRQNTSKDTPRIGIAIRYTTPDVVQESPMKPIAMLVRGRDAYGNFETLPPPAAASYEQQVRQHRKIVARIRASIMTTAAKPT
jgi:ectoine hydroxylase-related dioxygenase (phytanoyl-CoA dioxygenase family)